MSLKTFEVRRRYEGDKIIDAHKVFQFPGGESHIEFTPTASTQVAYVTSGNGDDLAALAMWADAAKRHRGTETFACIPYLPGARMDRGVPLGAKVYADVINGLGIDHVICVDPHSEVAPALYDNLTVLDAVDVMPYRFPFTLDGIIAPDIGAVKRAEKAAIKYGVPIYQAQKHRDFTTGKLSGFSCEELPNNVGDYLLVDDICDGGGTFNGLADVLPDVGLHLWVTHGIFSQGLDKLLDNFDNIYTTDSHDGARQTISQRLLVSKIMKTMLDSTGRFQF